MRGAPTVKLLRRLPAIVQTTIKRVAYDRSRVLYEAERDALTMIAHDARLRGDDPVRAVLEELQALD